MASGTSPHSHGRTSQVKYMWVVYDFNPFIKARMAMTSPTFQDRGPHGISWYMKLSTQPAVEYSPQFDGGWETSLTVHPTKDFDLDLIKIRCSISLLTDGQVENGPYSMHRCTSGRQVYWSAPRLFCQEALLDSWRYHTFDGQLRIVCQVEMTDMTNGVDVSRLRDTNAPTESIFVKDFRQLYLNRSLLSDVTVNIQKHSFPAHKVILAARSPVFAAMFQSQTKENLTGRVDITDVEPDVFEKLLHFIYTGVVDDINGFSERLLVAADKYQLDDLKSICEKELIEGLCVENACQLLLLADRHSARQFKNKICDFIISNLRDVLKTEDWDLIKLQYGHLESEIFGRLDRELSCARRTEQITKTVTTNYQNWSICWAQSKDC